MYFVTIKFLHALHYTETIGVGRQILVKDSRTYDIEYMYTII